MVANGRVRPPAQDRRKMLDEEGVVKRHVDEEATARDTADTNLGTRVTNERTAREADTKDIRDNDIGVYSDQEGPNPPNLALKPSLKRVYNEVFPASGGGETLLKRMKDLEDIVGAGGENATGMRKEIKDLNQWQNGMQAEHGTLANMRDNTTEAKQDAGKAQADANQLRNDLGNPPASKGTVAKRVDDLEDFRGRGSGFAAAVDLTGAGVAHKH